MGKIKRLNSIIIDRIAAGEVIERPASVVKELVENSFDAFATHIEIHTIAGGSQKIIVKDNGIGISKEDLPLSIEKYATSKIQSVQDVEKILSFGFRGEALASIASISHIEIQSKYQEEEIGNQLIAKGGNILSIKPYPCLKGTKIIVEDLFFSTPARKKFLKSEQAENRAIFKEIVKLSLSKPEITLEYYKDKKKVFYLEKISKEQLPIRLEQIFKTRFSDILIPLYFQKDFIKIYGWIGKPRLQRMHSDHQFLFFNDRPVEIKNLSFIIKNTYGELLPEGSKPVFFLFYELPPEYIDVNVHPTKKEIRLLQENIIFHYTIEAIRKTLIPHIPISIQTHELKPKITKTTPTPYIEKSNNQKEILYPVEEILNSSIEVFHISESTQTSFQNSREKNSIFETNIQEEFLPEKHFGIIFGTYILAIRKDDFFIIDQHTAHERINYEKKKQLLEANQWNQQILFNPIPIHFTPEEMHWFEEHKEQIETMGFSFDWIGESTIAIREIPDYLQIGKEKEILKEILYKISKGLSHIQLYDEWVAMKACKASIRKNEPVAPEIISKILIDLSKCKEPARCPHGRPTMLKISRKQLDYLFYRTGF